MGVQQLLLRSIKILLALQAVCVGHTVLAVSPEVARIKRVLNHADPSFVVLEFNEGAFATEGERFEAFRRAPGVEIPIPTGKVRIVKLMGKEAIAKIVKQGSSLSKASSQDLNFLMAGDLVLPINFKIVRDRRPYRDIVISYYDLFRHPKAGPQTFEFSTDGRQRLDQALKELGSQRFEKIIVKAYTDHEGDQGDNQAESYQRALVVKQYITNQISIDPDYVLAMGFGELDPVDDSYVAGYSRANRRVVIKLTNADF